MKKWIKKLSRAALCVLSATMLFSTCEIGLGEAVDTAAPTLSITYPPTASTIRGTFVIAGECSDDKKVSSVEVSVRNTGTSKDCGKFSAVISGNTWKLNLNESGEYNGFAFPDGKYVAEVQATDGTGRKSGISSLSFDIDNTAPVVILNSPGIDDLENATGYGTKFKIAGTVGDDHDVKNMVMKVYDVDASGKKGSLITTIERTNIETAGGTEVTFAEKNTNTDEASKVLNDNYKKLYDYEYYLTNNLPYEDKKYICELSVSDCARQFTMSDADANASGNTTEKFYFYDDIYEAWLKAGLETSDIKKIFNGTFTGEFSASPIDTPRLKDDGTIDRTEAGRKTNENGKAAFEYARDYLYRTNAAFILNPDASPTYTVVGIGRTKQEVMHDTKQLSSVISNQQMTVQVTAGRNGTLIEPSTLEVFQYGPYDSKDELKAKISDIYEGKETEKKIRIAENSTYTSSSVESYIYSVALAEISPNKYYAITATGKDKDGEQITNSASTYFACIGQQSGTPPQIEWDEHKDTDAATHNPEELAVIGSDNLTFTGTVKSEDEISLAQRKWTLTVTNEGKDTGFNATLGTWTGTIGMGTIDPSTNLAAWNLNLSSGTNSNGDSYQPIARGMNFLYTLKLEMVNGGGKSESTRKFHIDTKDPEVKLNSINPEVENKSTDPSTMNLNGSFSVAGSVEEINLDDVWYEIKCNGETYKSSSIGAKYSLSGNEIYIDSTDVATFKTTDEQPVEIVVYAKDKAGNIGSTSSTTLVASGNPYVISQKSDNPVITGNNFNIVTDSEKIKQEYVSGSDEGNVFKAENIMGMVEDDDGIKSIIAYFYNADGTEYTAKPSFTLYTIASQENPSKSKSFSIPFGELPEEDGIFQIEVVAYDTTYDFASDNYKKFRKSSTGKFYIGIDKNSPAITETKVGPNLRYANKNVPIEYGGTISDECKLNEKPLSVKIKKAGSTENPVVHEIVPTYTGATEVLGKSGSWSYTYTLPSDAEDGTYELSFEAVDKANNVSMEKRSVAVDNTPPAITIKTVTPSVEKDGNQLLNGTFKVTGVVSENYLEKVWYEIKSGVNTILSTDASINKFGEWYAFNDEITIDSTDVAKFKTADNTPVEIIVHAIDKAGNEGAASTTAFNKGNAYTVNQESDRPVISGNNFNIVKDKAKLNKTLSGTDYGNVFDSESIMGMVTDDDGIKSITAKFYNEDGTVYSAKPSLNLYTLQPGDTSTTTKTFSIANTDLPETAGVYQVEIEAVDTTWQDASDAYKQYRTNSTGKFYFAIDKASPVVAETEVGNSLQYANVAKTIVYKGKVSDDFKLADNPLSVKIKKAGSTDDPAGYPISVTYNGAGETAGKNGSWEYQFALPSGATDGTYELTFEAKDNFGRTSSVTRSVTVDLTPPAIGINSVAPNVSKTESGITKKYLNGTFNVTGVVTESYLDKVWYEIKSNDGTQTVTVDSRNLTPSVSGEWYSFNSEIEIDSTNVSKFKTYDNTPVVITVHAIDKAGNTAERTTTQFNSGNDFTVLQSTDKPVISGSNFAFVTDTKNLSQETDLENNKGNVFDSTNNKTLIGTVTDDDGIKTITVSIRKEDGSSFTNAELSTYGITSQDQNITGFTVGTTSTNFNYALPTKAGVYKVSIKAVDTTWDNATASSGITVEQIRANREATYGPFFVAVDSEYPVLEETKVNTTDIKYVDGSTNSTVTFEGTATDDWKLMSPGGLVVKATYTAPAAGSTPQPEAALSKTITVGADGKWNYSIDLKNTTQKTYSEGLYTLTFTATDAGNKSTSITRKVYKDEIAPVFGTSTITDPTATGYVESNVKPYIKTQKFKRWEGDTTNEWFNTTTLNISGGVSDNASGVKKVEYTLDATVASPTWTELSGTSGFGGTIAGVSNNGIITLRATDNAGNHNTATIIGIKIDTDVPSASVTEIDGSTEGLGNKLSNGKADIVIKGMAEDALSEIYALKIKVGEKSFAEPDVSVIRTSSENPFVQAKDASGNPIEGTFEWTATIPKEKIAASGTVWAQITDGAGNTSDVNLFSLQVDKVDPTINFNDSIKDATVNKKITVSGTGNDDQKLALVNLYYKYGAADTAWKEVTADGTDDDGNPLGAKVSGTYNWSLADLDTEKAFGTTIYDCDSTKAGTQVTLKAVATDAAGNTSETTTTITVDQDTDRPEITFTNLPALTGMTSVKPILFSNTTMLGTLSDDDGITPAVELKIIEKPFDDENAPTKDEWTAASKVTHSGGSWSYKGKTGSGLKQGKQKIYFYVKDAKGEEFVSMTVKDNNAVYIKDADNSFGSTATPDSILYLQVDTIDPTGTDARFNFYSKKGGDYKIKASEEKPWPDTVEGVTFGGDLSKFAMRITANDDNGIKSVTAKMGESNEVQGYKEYTFSFKGDASDSLKNGVWECKDILTGGTVSDGNLKDGLNNFIIEITDNADRKFSKTVQFNVDNTAPEITITSPSSTTTVSGNVNAYGAVNEASTMQYAISTSPTVSPDDTTTPITSYTVFNTPDAVTIADIKDKVAYSDMNTAGLIWYLYFDNDNDASQIYTHDGKTLNGKLIDFGITTQADIDKTDDPFSSIVELYLWVKATDIAGNVSFKTHKLLVDPQGDRPVSSINYPEKDASVIGGGNIKVYGETEAKLGRTVGSVWVQMLSKSTHSGPIKDASGAVSINYPDNWNDVVEYTTVLDAEGNETHPCTVTKFEWTEADLDYFAEKGYDIYKMSTFQDISLSEKWVKGTSHLAAGEKATDYGALVNYAGSTWNVTINKNGEFNPVRDAYNLDKDETNKVVFRTYTKDSVGKVSVPVDRVFSVDNGTPYFGASQPFYLVHTDETGILDYDAAWDASVEYADGMFVKGSWYIVGSIEDDNNVRTLSVKDTLKNTTVELFENGEPKSNTGLFAIKKVSQKEYYFKYKLETASGVGELSFLFTADDDSNHTGQKDIVIKFDNTSPVLNNNTVISQTSNYNINPEVKQSSNFYVMSSTVTENAVGGKAQSGFDYVAFYFMRRVASGTSIFDPMLARQDESKVAIPENRMAITGLEYMDGMYWKKYSGISRDAENLDKITVNGITSDKNIHDGGLAKIGGKNYLISSVSGNEITLAGNPSVNFTDIYFARGVMVVNNTITESSGGTLMHDGYFSAVVNDDGDRMIESVKKEGTTWTWEADVCSKNIPDGPIELHYIAFDKAGNYNIGIMSNVDRNTFNAFDTQDAKDSISVFAYDAEHPAFVSNNQPRIAGVIFGTDDNGDGVVKDVTNYGGQLIKNEMVTTYGGWYNLDDPYENLMTGVTVNGKDAQGKAITEFNLPQDLSLSVLTIKGATMVKPEIVGGNNGLAWSYSVKTTKDAETPEYTSGLNDINSDDSITDDVRPEIKLELSTIDLLKTGITDGNKKQFSFYIWDKTEGTTAGTNSQKATINMIANVILKDTVPPVASFEPFRWRKNATTGVLETSLYEDSKDNGHIELESDWTKASIYDQTATSGLTDGDPKVSGKITLRGKVNDNVGVDSIWIKIPGFDGKTEFKQVAHRDHTPGGDHNGEWISDVNIPEKSDDDDEEGGGAGTGGEEEPDDGIKFELDREEFSQKEGNTVYFKISFDSARVQNVAVLDVNVDVQAYDRGMMVLSQDKKTISYTANDPSDGSTTSTTAELNTPRYRMDIVPYISAIETNNRGASGLKKNNIRSASGKYSIIKGNAGDFITVKGFNLNPTAALIVSSSTVSGTVEEPAATATNVVRLTKGTVADDYTSVGLKNNGSKSGYLELFVNGIRSINNVNNNDVYGTYPVTKVNGEIAVSEYKYMPNREADYNSTKNVRLTDDRYLRFFDMKDTGFKNGYYPNMIMNGNNPVFGIVDLNGKHSISGFTEQSLKEPYESSGYMPQRITYNVTSNKITDIEYLCGGLTWSEMAMVKDAGGRYIHASTYDYAGAAMHIFYNRYAEQHTWKKGSGFSVTTYTDGWAQGTGYEGYNGNWAQNGNNNAIAIDKINLNGSLTGRYQNLRLAVKGDSTTQTGASVYMAYYDDNTQNKDIIFRTFKIASSAFTNGNTLKDGYSNLRDEDTDGRKTVGSNGSRYLDVGVTSDNHVVVVYYDTEQSKLVLKYSKEQIDGSSTNPTINWQTSTAKFDLNVGFYVSLAIDTNNGIHIAAFDAADSDLVYMYLSSYNSGTMTKVKVDQASSVGNWTQIKIRNNVPYIAYYNSTETGGRDAIKLAYANNVAGKVTAGVDADTGYTTGAWEYMTVPAITPPQGGDTKFRQVCLDFDSNGVPVVGYLGTNLEFGNWIGE